MHDQIVLRTGRETLVVLLQVRPPALTPGPDGGGVALVHVPARARLVHVRTVLVERRQQQPHAVRPPDVGLGRPLVTVGEVGREPAGGHGRPVHILVIEALVPHPLRERPGVGGESGDADAEVVVDLEYLLLVGRQL